MSYLEPTQAETDYDQASDDHAQRNHRTSPKPAFSGLEWSVVALAQRDSLSSLKEPGRISKALGAIFGTSDHSRLADGRLEALRRLAVHAWHKGWAVPVSELRAFKESGFSIGHYELLQERIGRSKRETRRQGA